MQTVDEVLRQIAEALWQDRYDDALALGRNAVRRFPQDPEVRAAHGDALWCTDELEAACRAYSEAARLAPARALLWANVARCRFALADFVAAREAAQRAQAVEETPETMEILCRLAERESDLEAADRWGRRAHALDPEEFPLPHRVDEKDFRRLVTEAVNEIPESFQNALAKDVAILVEPVPEKDLIHAEKPPLDPGLLGLYVGVPLPEREEIMGGRALPDRIYLFQRNLEHEATSRDELVKQIRITLFHEVGHYFGFSDEDLEERDFG